MKTQVPRYSYVVARSRNHVIGCENRLPWHLTSDLKRFKTLTVGKPVIMGRKTYESIGRPLPNRPNIVIAREQAFAPNGVFVARSKEEAAELAEKFAKLMSVDEIMVIGGEGIFKLFDKEVSCVYLTEVDAFIDNGDAFFRNDFSSWIIADKQVSPKSENDEFRSEYIVYRKHNTVCAQQPVPERVRQFA